MPAFRLLARLVLYYGVLIAAVAGALTAFPILQDYLPIGRAQALIAQAGASLDGGRAGIKIAHVESLGASLVWLASAIGGALATSLPVSWVYMEIRDPEQCDQSLIDTIVILPLVVTSIVVIVQHSLALSFSLAGIAGVSRFRNSLKSSGDLLFILLAVGIGLAAGIGAMELALVTSIAFNLCFLVLWSSEYGERRVKKRYLNEFGPMRAAVAEAEVSVVTVPAAAAPKRKRAAKPPSGTGEPEL